MAAENTNKAKVHSRQFFTSALEIPNADWNAIHRNRNVFLSLPYLEALQSGMQESMKFFYAISYDASGKPLLIASFQLVRFVDKRKKYTEYLCKFSYHVTKKLSDALNVNVLVCGNVFSDGENGLLWDASLNPQDAMDEAEAIVQLFKNQEKVEDEASMVLFKEFWPHSSAFSDRLKEHKYRDFRIDVNMVLKLHPSWTDFDAYLSSMKTKFRTRAKSTLKRSESLELRLLSSDEIRSYADRIEILFGNVLEKSDFSVGVLNAITFASLQERLPEHFFFYGAFNGTNLVGFCSAVLNDAVLEANFVGLDYEANSNLSVYQRFLLHYVELGLKSKVHEVHFGRTAELMKSQIGALPTDMHLYIKHRKSVPNLLLKPIIQSIAPSEFELRPPFKEEFSQWTR